MLRPLLLGALVLAGCHPSTSDGVTGGPSDAVTGAGGSAPVVVTPPATTSSGGSAGAPPGAVDCEGVGGEIYAVTEDATFLRFLPPTRTFEALGTLQCTGVKAGVYSMAVDRAGQATVLFQDGQLRRVSPADLSCQKVAYEPKQKGWQVFGMAYAATAGATESLFVADATRTLLLLPGFENGLGRLTSTTLRLSTIGAFDGDLYGRLAELTGRGDGRLFAFFVQEPSIAEIDPATAHVLSNTPLPVPAPTAWAFAHWGGAFYVFAAPGSSTSRLYRHRPGGEAATLLLDTGYRVVGAGVSTCAPLDDGGTVAD